jgi:predicted PurR-regulated permease PerM
MMKIGEIDPNHVIESAVRLGIIAVLIFAGLRIVAPFLELMIWGIILSVALGPTHLWLMRRFGGSATRAAIVLTLAGLVFVVVPSLLLGDALGSTAFGIANDLRDGSVEIPPPPTSVRDWPVIGESAYNTWLQASTNIGALLARSSQQIIAVGGRLLSATGSALIGLLEFAGSIFVAGFLLAKRDMSAQAARDLFDRAAPEVGDRLLGLTEQTIRSVAAGVLGVAIIQSTFVGIGLLVAGVPYAGVLSLLCLLLGIVQLPMGLVVTPIVIWKFMHGPTTEAVIFLAYMVPVGLLDNVLRPILMGRGNDAPMLVILIGALGGFAANGFLGLFTGAIILVLIYTLVVDWLHKNEDPEESSALLETE